MVANFILPLILHALEGVLFLSQKRYVLCVVHGKARQRGGVKVGVGQVHRADAAIGVSGEIIDAMRGVGTRGVDGIDGATAVSQGKAARTSNGVHDVEKAVDRGNFIRLGQGVMLCKHGANKAGGRGRVAGQTHRAHAARISGQSDLGAQGVLRRRAVQPRKIAKMCHVISEIGAVGQHADAVVVYFQSISD